MYKETDALKGVSGDKLSLDREKDVFIFLMIEKSKKYTQHITDYKYPNTHMS